MNAKWRRPLQLAARLLLALLFARTAVASAGSPAPAAPAAPAGGTVGSGPGTCTDATLTAALAGGGTVTFNCGGPATILVTSPKTIAADTTLIGGDVITLTGGSATRLFNVNSAVTLALQHIILDQAASTGSDGGAIANAGTLHLDGVTIQNSHTDLNHSGAALYSTGPVTIDHSRFISNTAGSGGALYVTTAQAIVAIHASNFINNRALNTLLGYGGAIWAGPLAQLTLTDGQVIENVAQRGGGIYLSPGAAVTLTADSQLDVDSNSGVIEGAGLDNAGGSLRVTNTSIIGNLSNFTTGAGQGGGIASYGPLTLSGDLIVGNTANVGGGVYVSSTVGSLSVSIESTGLTGNGAVATDGGGVYLQGPGVAATIVDSSFTGNIAQRNGAGLYRYGAYLTLLRASITGNVAQHTGAGLFVDGPTPTTGNAVAVRDSTINTNVNVPSTTAGSGIENLAQLLLTNVTLKDNDDGLYTGSAATSTLANTVLDNKLANCTLLLPVDDLGNFATSVSPCGFSVSETGPDAKLGAMDYSPRNQTYFYVPLAGSPLLGAAISTCSLHDQRDALRPNACDSGAVQHNGLLPWLFLPLVER